MADYRRTLHQTLDNVRVVDPHCHLRPQRPCADSLADIVLYHHVWVELVSSGMPEHEVSAAGLPHELADPGMPALERVRRALKYLDRIQTTTAGLCLRWILRDLYGVDGLDEGNVERVCDAVAERAAEETWQAGFLRDRCGIERSISVEPGRPSATILTATSTCCRG